MPNGPLRTYAYPVVLEAGDAAGVVVASFPDIPEAVTEGDDAADARRAATDALGLALLAYLKAGRALPAASPGGDIIVPAPDVTAKIAVLETFARAGITRTELARRLGRDEKEARRILDPMHPTKLPALTAALAVLGVRLVVGVEDAA